MDLYEVVKKLIGEVNPIGETNEDEKRYENLKVMTGLVDKLLTDINDVVSYKDRQEWSLKKAGTFANLFLDKIGIIE